MTSYDFVARPKSGKEIRRAVDDLPGSSLGPRIDFSPNEALLDEPVIIRPHGFGPGQIVALRAETEDGRGVKWFSQAVFMADSQGNIDLAKQPPLYGTYDKADMNGLFWSMRPEVRGEIARFNRSRLRPLSYIFTAWAGGQTLASARLERRFIAPDVRREDVRMSGLVGTFFCSPGRGKRPGLIVLGGAEGGIPKHAAALLSSHGYAALALAYFGVKSLPGQLADIPLEYFQKAIVWLARQRNVDLTRIALIGFGKGGELALLLGATTPTIRAVAAISPSGLVWQGASLQKKSSWTCRGKAVPFVPLKTSFPSWVKLLNHPPRLPLATRSHYQAALHDKAAVERATIAVEKIKGPVLLISTGRDQTWPSTALAQIAYDRLAKHRHPYWYQHLQYELAGGEIELPNLPIPDLDDDGPSAWDDEARHTAQAAVDVWQYLVSFLDKNLKHPA